MSEYPKSLNDRLFEMDIEEMKEIADMDLDSITTKAIVKWYLLGMRRARKIYNE